MRGTTLVVSALLGLGVLAAPPAAALTPPVANDDAVTVTEGISVDITLSGTDVDGDDLTFAIDTPPSNGTIGTPSAATCGATDCTSVVSYKADIGGSFDSFTFTVSGGGDTSAPATVDITIEACGGAIISNGTVQLGVNCLGHLNVDGGTPSSGEGVTEVGLRYVPTNADSTSPGCLCEGWGAADATSGVTGYANESSGTSDNLSLVGFSSDADSATSTVDVGTSLRVTHDYQPTSTPNLYRVGVSIQNISGGAVHLRYRRVMDWDVEPTAFAEFVTMRKGSSPELVFTSDDGFATADPLAGPSDLGNTGSFTDKGPDDHGALFDFDFGGLAAGATKSFTTYYGAAGTETGVISALTTVGAEAFSMGQPSTPEGPSQGTPNSFVFAFAGVGGAPVLAPPDAVNDSLVTLRDTAAKINVLANDKDPNNDPLAVTGNSTPAHGTASCTGAGECTYTPAAGYVGPDSFTYTITDGVGGSDTATVSVTVAGVDVSISKSESGDPVAVGNAFAYRLVVRTATPVAAGGVTVTDTLPKGFRVRNVTTTAGTCAVSAGTLTCPVGTVPAGGSATITVNGAFVTAGATSNTARVTASGDTNPANNQATTSTSVTGKSCTITGTFGNDRLRGTAKKDVICGLGGNDRIRGLAGNDTLYGNDGFDRLAGFAGNDQLVGGPGLDTATFGAATGSVSVNLKRGVASGEGSDRLSTVENVRGSRFDDSIVGNAVRNILSGGKGDDLLKGLAGGDLLKGNPGDDRLSGGKGNDALNGGPGDDSCSQGSGSGPVTSC